MRQKTSLWHKFDLTFTRHCESDCTCKTIPVLHTDQWPQIRLKLQNNKWYEATNQTKSNKSYHSS